MGHERLPQLPKSEKWKKIVSDIASISAGYLTAADIVKSTTEAIDRRFRKLHLDPGVQDSLFFLVSLTVAARSDSPKDSLKKLGIDLKGLPATPLKLTQSLTDYMRTKNASKEYSEIAKSAVASALATFYTEESSQKSLFNYEDDPFYVWQKASSGKGFSKLTHHYFSALTSNYIRYFLGREASGVLPTVESRESFHKDIESHIDRVTRHGLEVSKIAQSFSAGWYNKNATKELPSRRKTSGYLYVALNKIRDTLKREEG